MIRYIPLFLLLSCAAPTMIVAQSSKVVRVYWDLNTEPDIYAYRIWLWRTEAPNQGPFLLHPAHAWSFVNLYYDYPGEWINFAVSAIDTAGNESELSESVAILMDTSLVIIDVPPKVPTGLGVEIITKTEVQIQ